MICIGAGGKPAVGAGSFCKKMRSRIKAFEFLERGALTRFQLEAFASIKRDYRRECTKAKEKAPSSR